MTQVADFLLQPTTGRTTGANPARDPLGAASRTESGQDFSRLLIQQRQQADQRAPIAAPAPKAAAPAAKPAQQPARQEQAARPAEQARNKEPTREQRSNVAETDTERQKLDSDAVVDAQEEPISDEEQALVSTDEQTLPPGLLNPLLEQIRQVADEEGDLPEVEATEDLEGVAAVQSFLAMIEGAPVAGAMASASSQTAEGKESPLEQINRLLQRIDEGKAGVQAKEEGQLAGRTQSLALDEALGEEETEVKLQQLLTGGALRQEGQSATSQSQGQSLQAARVEGAGEARTDTLMRSEAVQSAQAARQVPGQPLNMQQPGWSKELTDKVMWMSSQNLKSAEIKMNPAELGRLEIRVQMGQEHTQISFSSAHAGVRESLDGQMHRLREMLEQQGMNNVDVEVSGQSHQEQEQQTAGGRAGQASDETANDEQLVAVSELDAQSAGHSGLVSHYV